MTLARDRRASTALEFALCFPAVLLFMFSLFAVYSLISTWRAMDVGIERALRYAAVRGGTSTSNVTTAFSDAASVIWRDVGACNCATVSPSNFAAGGDVTVSVTYTWAAPAILRGTPATTLFNGVTLTASGTMRVIN